MEELSQFIIDNRKAFPPYFKAKEIKKYHAQGQLYKLEWLFSMVGFYVIDGTQLKSLFIKKEYRTNSSLFIGQMFKQAKKNLDYCTMAVNERSPRIVRLALENGFVATDNYVQGKTHKLRLYLWS